MLTKEWANAGAVPEVGRRMLSCVCLAILVDNQCLGSTELFTLRTCGVGIGLFLDCTQLRTKASTIYQLNPGLRSQAHDLKSANSNVSHGILPTSTSSTSQCLLLNETSLYRDTGRKAPFVRSENTAPAHKSTCTCCTLSTWADSSASDTRVPSETKQLFRGNSVPAVSFLHSKIVPGGVGLQPSAPCTIKGLHVH